MSGFKVNAAGAVSMLKNDFKSDDMLEAALRVAVDENPHLAELDDLPEAIYLTDPAGTVTYFNQACVRFAGRTPEVGKDRWCVTWRLYTKDGEFLPHDECPMAVAIKEEREVRGVEAVAERPDGTRIPFRPHPTPLFDKQGNLTGAINMLVGIPDRGHVDFLLGQAQRCRRLAASTTDDRTARTLALMAAEYGDEAARIENMHKN